MAMYGCTLVNAPMPAPSDLIVSHSDVLLGISSMSWRQGNWVPARLYDRAVKFSVFKRGEFDVKYYFPGRQ